MKTKLPALQETLDYLNKQEFENFVKAHRKDHTVTVGNGKKIEMPLNEAVGFLYDRNVEDRKMISKIHEDTTILRDVITLNGLIKKHPFLFGGGLVSLIATAIRIWIG